MKDKYINPYTDFGFIKGFQKAEISKYNQDELKKYEESLKIYRDLKGVVDTSFYEGEKIGIEKGKIESKYETVKKMKLKGFDVKLISEITGLTENEIEKL